MVSRMTPLNDRLAEVGLSSAVADGELGLVFKWMQQATAEIERLQGEVDRLKFHGAKSQRFI